METGPLGILILREKPGHPTKAWAPPQHDQFNCPWQRLWGTQGTGRAQRHHGAGEAQSGQGQGLLDRLSILIFRKPLLGKAEDFTVYIKNFIRFPKFNFSKYVGLGYWGSIRTLSSKIADVLKSTRCKHGGR